MPLLCSIENNRAEQIRGEREEEANYEKRDDEGYQDGRAGEERQKLFLLKASE